MIERDPAASACAGGCGGRSARRAARSRPPSADCGASCSRTSRSHATSRAPATSWRAPVGPARRRCRSATRPAARRASRPQARARRMVQRPHCGQRARRRPRPASRTPCTRRTVRCRAVGVLTMPPRALGGIDGVAEQHRPGRRADPAEPRRDPARDLRARLVDVGDDPPAFHRDAGAHDRGARLHHVGA